VADIRAREIALISSFSAIWIASELYLGPMVGKISVGSFSFHGSVNRFVGWALMLILAEHSRRFGRVSSMSAISAIGTRFGRTNLVEGLFVGLGYFIGGLTFDALYLLTSKIGLAGRKVALLLIAFVSSTFAMLPYIFFRLAILGPIAFTALAPVYVYSTLKGVGFSLLGVLAAVAIVPRLKKLRM